MQNSGHPQLDLVLGLYGRESRWPVPSPLAAGPKLGDALRGIDALGGQLRQLQSASSAAFWNRAALTLQLDFDGNGAASLAPAGQGGQAELQFSSGSDGIASAVGVHADKALRHAALSGNRARRLRRIVRHVLNSRADLH